jgi:hypothetical protein
VLIYISGHAIIVLTDLRSVKDRQIYHWRDKFSLEMS